jgi:hypothetical protein
MEIIQNLENDKNVLHVVSIENAEKYAYHGCDNCDRIIQLIKKARTLPDQFNGVKMPLNVLVAIYPPTAKTIGEHHLIGVVDWQ